MTNLCKVTVVISFKISIFALADTATKEEKEIL